MNIHKAIQSAFEFKRTGNLQQAVQVCRKILEKQPKNIQILQLLGTVYCQLQNYDDAIRYLKKTIQLDPNNTYAYNNLGVALEAIGRFDEAISNYQKLLRIDPNTADTYYNLGNAFKGQGQLDEAVTYYQKALQLNPKYIAAYNNLGAVLIDKGQLDAAILCYQKAIQLNPNDAQAYNNLGYILKLKGQLDEALTCYRKALQYNLNNAQVYDNMGIALQAKGLFDEAIQYYKKALQINPNYSDAYVNLGAAFHKKGEFDEAITYYQKTLKLNPLQAEAFNNLGKALLDKGHIQEAIPYFQKAIQVRPHYALAYFHMSFVLLLSGDFERGWKEYEWRWGLEEHPPRNFQQPMWNGSDLKGRTILLHAEQGLGDTMQFIRYAPLVAGKGARVAVEVQRELVTLLRSVEGVQQVVIRGEPLPEFDIHCPLLSLPLVFETTLENIPANVPYLKADSVLVEKWRDKIKTDNARMKIGLVWSGGPAHDKDRYRSCSLEIFSQLAQLKEITFYSLQKGEAAQQAKNPPGGMKLIDCTDEIHDFSDTAALIENLDLVISVDTSVAHLVGALGKRIWTLIPFSPDWRWMLNRKDSPWYPTMRLFRQPSLGDWSSVIENISRELRALIEKKPPEDSVQKNDIYNKNIQQQGKIKEEETLSSSKPLTENEHSNKDLGYQKEGKVDIRTDNIVAIILNCEGMGDCLFAIPVIKKIRSMVEPNTQFVVFTHHPNLFVKCPYVEKAFGIHDTAEREKYKKIVPLFDPSKLPHWLMDTFDFISIPAGIGELSFREKQLEYFPVEEDHSQHFDVVINTSVTWPSRSWQIENWQKLADYILEEGYSIAVVGKDVYSKADNMWKKSQTLKGCTDLTNKLSLDQAYYTIKNCDLFITCQNGLSVLSGATDTEIIVLDMSIEWSKRAIYRKEDPHCKVSYVKGNCKIYCCASLDCSIYGEFRCIPTVEQVIETVSRKLKA